MVHARKSYTERGPGLRLRLQSAEPEIDSYIASLKKKYQRYAMPIDDLRRLVDTEMGKRTLTEFLAEARQ